MILVTGIEMNKDEVIYRYYALIIEIREEFISTFTFSNTLLMYTMNHFERLLSVSLSSISKLSSKEEARLDRALCPVKVEKKVS